MRLPKELTELVQFTDTQFQPKWEFGRITNVFLILFGRCYESRYKGHLIRYYKDSYWSRSHVYAGSHRYTRGAAHYIEKRLKLFHSRPLNLGLQCYFNVSQISSFRLSGSEWRNLFASRLRTRLSDVKCYAAESTAAEALLLQGKVRAALGELRDLVQNLSSGRFVLVDEGVMIFFFKKPDRKMLDTLHQLSTALSESALLPDQRTYRTLNLGYLLGLLAFFAAFTALMIVMGREGLGFANFFP